MRNRSFLCLASLALLLDAAPVLAQTYTGNVSAVWTGIGERLMAHPNTTWVAIGTDWPYARLQIVNGLDAQLGADSTGFLMLGRPTSANLIFDDNEIMARNGLNYSTLYLNHDGGDVMIHGGLTEVQRVRVTHDGRVMIGAANDDHPAAKLQVSGAIVAPEIIVTPDGWADAVFRDGYRLRSLESLSSFVKTNMHLPGIPSEADVAEKGLAVAAFNKELLRHVEELTLHVIAQHEKIKALEAALQGAAP